MASQKDSDDSAATPQDETVEEVGAAFSRPPVTSSAVYSPPLCAAEGPERGPVQRHAVQVQLVGHAELRGGGGRGGRRLCAPASAYGHPAAQPPAARVPG